MLIYLTLFLLWAGHFLVDFMIAIFPVYKTMMGMDLAWAGVMISAAAFGGEWTQLLFGTLSDRGYLRAVLCCGVLLPCASLCYVYCDGATFLFPLILLTYIGSGAFHPAAAGLASSLSARYKSLYVAIFASGGSLGLATGQLGFFYAYEWLGSAIAFLMIPSFVIAAVFMCCRLSKKVETVAPLSREAPSVWSLFRYPQMAWLYVLLVCNTTFYFSIMFMLPDLLIERGAPNWVCFGGGHLAMVLGSCLAMVPMGYVADRFGARPIFICLTAGGFLTFHLFLAQAVLSTPATLVLLGLTGMLLGSVHPIGIGQAGHCLPHYPGLVSAFAMGMVWCLSEACGPISSVLTYAFPKEIAVSSSLFTVSGLTVLSLYAVSRLPKTFMPIAILDAKGSDLVVN